MKMEAERQKQLEEEAKMKAQLEAIEMEKQKAKEETKRKEREKMAAIKAELDQAEKKRAAQEAEREKQRAEAWVARMNAEADAKAEEKQKKEEEEVAKKKAAEEAAAERKKLFRTKSQVMAEEEEQRRQERARRQEEEFGCAIAGGFEKGDYVIAQNNMSVQGEIIVKKGTRGVVRGPSETDPQNRVSVAFDKREKAGYAQINVVHFEIKVTDAPLQKDPNVSELIEKIMTPRDARSKQVVNELEED